MTLALEAGERIRRSSKAGAHGEAGEFRGGGAEIHEGGGLVGG